jgi:hypothetical protein
MVREHKKWHYKDTTPEGVIETIILSLKSLGQSVAQTKTREPPTDEA